MLVKWQELEISQAELEELLNFNLLSTWAIDIGRVFWLRQTTYRKSLLFTEACSLFLVFLLLFPIKFILFRNFGWLSNNTDGLILILLSTFLGSMTIIIVINYYLWRKAKQLKVFTILLEKVTQYNSLLSNLKLATQLNLFSSHVSQEQQATDAILELKTALVLTKKSLINSIELEKIIHRDRFLANNRYQLLANLESGLVNLASLSEPNEYQQLLSEAIAIGLSVHQEIRKTQTLRKSVDKP